MPRDGLLAPLRRTTRLRIRRRDIISLDFSGSGQTQSISRREPLEPAVGRSWTRSLHSFQATERGLA